MSVENVWIVFVVISILLMLKPMLKDVFSSPMTVEKFLSKPCPKGVKSPIYELCQKMVSDLSFLQPVSVDRGGIGFIYYVDGFGVEYRIRIDYTNGYNDPTGLSHYTITSMKLLGGIEVPVTLSYEEYKYFTIAWNLRTDIFSAKRRQEAKEREQLVRDEITKLYSQPPSEVIPIDQSN